MTAQPKTQNEMILDLLRRRGERGLTPLDALSLVGSFRLGARIWDVKLMLPDDEEIVTERASLDGKTFARYVLRKRVPHQGTLWDSDRS